MKRKLLLSFIAIFCRLGLSSGAAIASEEDWRVYRNALVYVQHGEWDDQFDRFTEDGTLIEIRPDDKPRVMLGMGSGPFESIDVKSTLLTPDGYIVFRRRSIKLADPGIEPAMYGPNKYKAWVDTGKLDLQNIKYWLTAIHCHRKMFAYWGMAEDLTMGPVEKTYGENPDKYSAYKEWRKFDKMLCNSRDHRKVPHTAGRILYLNDPALPYEFRKSLGYDLAIRSGILK